MFILFHKKSRKVLIHLEKVKQMQIKWPESSYSIDESMFGPKKQLNSRDWKASEILRQTKKVMNLYIKVHSRKIEGLITFPRSFFFKLLNHPLMINEAFKQVILTPVCTLMMYKVKFEWSEFFKYVQMKYLVQQSCLDFRESRLRVVFEDALFNLEGVSVEKLYGSKDSRLQFRI